MSVRKQEQEARKRIATELARYAGEVEAAKVAGFNEADTAALVKDMIGDVLGYDKRLEVRAEFQIRGRSADFVVKQGSDPLFVVEVKAVSHVLRDQDLNQAVSYAATQGLEWAVLTNGENWQCHRLVAPPLTEPVFQLQVVPDAIDDTKVEWFFRLSREGMAQGALAAAWDEGQAMKPVNIARAILAQRALRAIRLELRTLTEYPIDESKLRQALLHRVIRSDILDELADLAPDLMAEDLAGRRGEGGRAQPATVRAGDDGAKEGGRQRNFRWRLEPAPDGSFVLDCRYLPDESQSFQLSGSQVPPDQDFRPARTMLLEQLYERIRPLFPDLSDDLLRARAWAGVHKVYPSEVYKGE